MVRHERCYSRQQQILDLEHLPGCAVSETRVPWLSRNRWNWAKSGKTRLHQKGDQQPEDRAHNREIRRSTSSITLSALSATVSRSVRHSTSGVPGGSYGSSIPVTPRISPTRQRR